MDKSKILMYIIEIFLIISNICFVLFTETFSKIIVAIILLIIMLISNKFIKSHKTKGRYNKKLTRLMLGIAVIYLASIYVIRNLYWIL